ncbi:MAG: TonB-dependent receptor [Alphaproteobacteria bacterium]|nr:MAG: TonB-dependent receptor [Alphaproteobacteria bacterium]
MSPRLKSGLKLSLLGSTLLVAPAAVAADSADIPDEIVVTASRDSENKTDVGASISVVTKEELLKNQDNFVLDAIQHLPGVAISQNGAFGGQATVRIRGASADQTVVLIDGIQVNDISSPGGSFNFGTLSTYGLERVEVLKGPQAVYYGSDAIGGVVNVISETGGGALTGTVYGEYGAYETFRGGATVKGGGDRFGFNLSVNGVQTDGISAADSRDGNTEDDGYDAYGFRGRIDARMNDMASVEFIGYYNNADTDADSFGPVDGPDSATSEEYAFATRLHLDLLGGKFRNTFSVEQSGIDRESVSSGYVSTGNGKRLNFDYLGQYDLGHNLTLQGGAQRERVEASSVADESIGTNSLFGVLSYTDEKGLSLSAGVRYDDHETFGGTTNAQLRASYRFDMTGARFFANWGEGFKAPSLYQLTYICTWCGLTEPNADLKPETSEAWEIGVEQPLLEDRFVVSATYFKQDTTDMIAFDFSAGYINLASAKSKGVELGFYALIRDGIRLDASYTYTDATDGTTGDRLIRQPKHHIYAALNWDFTKALSAQASVTYNSNQIDSNAAIIDGWTRFDVRTAYKLNDTFELYARVDNLFDADYQVISGYGTPGRSLYAGIRSNF